MDLAGGAIGEGALAGPVLLVSGGGGGSAYSESLNEPIAPADALLPHSVFGPVIFESFGIADAVSTQAVMTSSLADGTVLGDVPSAPGGTISDFLIEAISAADAYAASGLWTVAAQSAGGWFPSSPAAANWTVVSAPSGLWLKH